MPFNAVRLLWESSLFSLLDPVLYYRVYTCVEEV